MNFILSRFFLLAFLCMASAFSYSNDVDYLAYIDRVNTFTDLGVSTKSCESLGMVVNWEEVNKVPDLLIADAIRSGVDAGFASSMISNAMREKREKEQFLANYYKENPEKKEEFIDYWRKRCNDLSENAGTKHFFKPVK